MVMGPEPPTSAFQNASQAITRHSKEGRKKKNRRFICYLLPELRMRGFFLQKQNK